MAKKIAVKMVETALFEMCDRQNSFAASTYAITNPEWAAKCKAVADAAEVLANSYIAVSLLVELLNA